jgi:hypothetical protein
LQCEAASGGRIYSRWQPDLRHAWNGCCAPHSHHTCSFVSHSNPATEAAPSGTHGSLGSHPGLSRSTASISCTHPASSLSKPPGRPRNPASAGESLKARCREISLGQATRVSQRAWFIGGQARVRGTGTQGSGVHVCDQSRSTPIQHPGSDEPWPTSILETWHHAIWLPRWQRAMWQEQSQGPSQGAKLGRMLSVLSAHHHRTNAHQNGPPSPIPLTHSPTPTLPPTFIGLTRSDLGWASG